MIVNEHTDPRTVIYSPAESATLGTKYLADRRSGKIQAIPIGLKSLDKDFLPMLPGELMTVIGRPGNGKTGFMVRWARERAAWLAVNGKKDRVVVYCSLEQSIEEMHAFDVAADTQISITDMARGNIDDDQWTRIMIASGQKLSRPLWHIGHSLDNEKRRKRPRLTVSVIGGALAAIEERGDAEKFEIDMIFIDYLQRVHFDGKPESKTIGMDEALNAMKDGALQFGCPFVVGVQAKRDVDQRDIPVPLMDDGQWTSAIEQVSDKSISVTRPRKYRKEGETFGSKNPVVVRGENQMVIALLKQKLGVSNTTYWASFNPVYNRLDELEMNAVDLSIQKVQNYIDNLQ